MLRVQYNLGKEESDVPVDRVSNPENWWWVLTLVPGIASHDSLADGFYNNLNSSTILVVLVLSWDSVVLEPLSGVNVVPFACRMKGRVAFLWLTV